jgi:hypothetical protein
MSNKAAITERFGGPGSSRQDRDHPEKGGRVQDQPAPGSPTNGRKSNVSGRIRPVLMRRQS